MTARGELEQGGDTLRRELRQQTEDFMAANRLGPPDIFPNTVLALEAFALAFARRVIEEAAKVAEGHASFCHEQMLLIEARGAADVSRLIRALGASLETEQKEERR